MRLIRVLVALFVAGSIGLMTGVAVGAQLPSIALSLTPATLTLGPAEMAQVIVVARIPVADLESITLSSFSDMEVAVQIADPVRSQPPLQGDQIWEVTLTRPGEGQPTGKVYFRANYQLRQSDGRLLPGVVVASLDVQERVPDPIENVITAKLETTLDTLQDRQTRQAFVVVRNISDVPVTVTQITAWPMPDVTTTVEDLHGGVLLDPQQAHPIALTLTAGDSVQPGKHLLVIRADAEWKRGGRPMTGSLVLNHEFEASAFGESAILQVMGIPALLFLPGFLFVITLVLLVRWSWKTQLLGLELDFKKPDFLWAAVTVSLLVVVLYPWLTGPFLSWLLRRPMTSRNLIQRYGFDDIVLLWFGAVLTGILCWVLGSSIYWLVGFVKKKLAERRERLEREEKDRLDEEARQEQARLAEQERLRRDSLVPTVSDLPLGALKKIAANNGWLNLKALKYTKDSKEQTVFPLPCPAQYAEKGKIWVAPNIVVETVNDKVDRERSNLSANPEDFGALIAQLEEHEKAGVPSLDWERSGALISGPTLVDEGDTSEEKGTGSVFWPLL
jgi:hypothetical protein